MEDRDGRGGLAAAARHVHDNRWLLIGGLSFLLISITHRTRQWWDLLDARNPPLSFDGTGIDLFYLSRYFLDDLMITGLFVIPIWLGRAGFRAFGRWRRWTWRTPAFLEVLALIAFLILASLIHIVSHRVIFELNTGLDLDVMIAGAEDATTDFIVEYIDMPTVVIFFAALLSVGVVHLMYRRSPRSVVLSALGLVITIVALSFQTEGFRPTEPLRNSPIHYILSELRRYEGGNVYSEDKTLPPPEQMKQLALTEWDNAVEDGRGRRLAKDPGFRANVVLVVLESTFFDYVFDDSYAGVYPMPFVKRLADEGWSFTNHFSTANHSSRSIFSLLTGLYPPPRRRLYCTRPDIALPTIYDLVGKSHDCFFVTPFKTTFAFPHRLLHKSEDVDVFDYYRIADRENRDVFALTTSDEAGVDKFIERMSAAQQPFFGVYVSYIPHFPYQKAAPRHRIAADVSVSRNRYYNNIRSLDTEVKRIYDHLVQTKQSDNTVFILLGDHGEAFGQHPDNVGHGQQSYRENNHTPLILHGPRFFDARVFSTPTSHVDVVPTMLDLMGASYNPKLLQGRSLLFEYKSPRSVFVYGREFTLSAIGTDLIKVQINYKRGEGWAYDLQNDRDEKNRLPIDDFRSLEADLLRFGNFQRHVIPAYDDTSRQSEAFFGLRHPGP